MRWARTLGWPLLGDVLSHTGQPLPHADLWLNAPAAQGILARAELVVQFGSSLTGKRLLAWQADCPAQTLWLVDPLPGRRDPGHHRGRRIFAAVEPWLALHPAVVNPPWAPALDDLAAAAARRVRQALLQAVAAGSTVGVDPAYYAAGEGQGSAEPVYHGADNAVFGQTGPKVGSFDGGWGASYMARIVGQKKAREIWFLCRQYDAEQALEMGLVNAVVPLARLEIETVRWCREMLANSPTALHCLKAALNADCDGQAGLQELADVLLPQADYRSVPLCTGDPDEALAYLAAMPGARGAKLKVGLYEAIRDSLTVNMLLSALPDLRRRLDANRRWTRDRALQFARYLAPDCLSRIDFLEEPCGRPADSLAFAAQTGIPIAWDESAREPGFTLHAAPGVAALVVKPSLTGTQARCRHPLDRAQGFGLTAVISSGVESSLALTQLSRLAHWLTPAVTPGLDTLSLMQAPLVRPWPGCDLPLLSCPQLEPIGTML